MALPLRIRFPRPVASKKNRRRPIGNGRTVASREASSDERALRTLALLEMHGQGFQRVESDDVEIVMRHFVEEDEIEIQVRALRPKPKGRSGRRRDLHGMIETVADALQGVAYANDNQVGSVRMERVMREEERCDSEN